MVYLPTADLQGGEIVTKIGGRDTIVFSPNKTEEHFACWFPKSLPQVVKSGCALAILFTIFPMKGNITGSALLWRNESRAIRHTLKRWLSKDAGSRERIALYHPIEHHVIAGKLSSEKLIMSDDGRLQILKKISDNFGFKLYFAHIEHDQKKKDDRDKAEYEVIKGSARIAKLLDVDGHLVTENLRLDEAHVPEGFFNGIKADYRNRLVCSYWDPKLQCQKILHSIWFANSPSSSSYEKAIWK